MSEEKTINEKTTAPELSLRYVLAQIENIAAETSYLREAISELGEMPVACGPGDIAGQAKAQALGDVVRCRETTNQKLLAFYEKVYDDLKPVKPSNGLMSAAAE